jgi:hypothetical protein
LTASSVVPGGREVLAHRLIALLLGARVHVVERRVVRVSIAAVSELLITHFESER